MKITAPKDCDNSPKRRLIKDFLIAWYSQDIDKVYEDLDESFQFEPINGSAVNDKDALKAHITELPKASKLTMRYLLSHGKYGSCNGQVEDVTGTTHFAYFFEFKSAGTNLIKSILLYNL